MAAKKIPLENYVVADWLAQQCQVNQGVIHHYAVRQRLRYYLFAGIRYLERNDAMPYGSVFDLRAGQISNSGAA